MNKLHADHIDTTGAYGYKFEIIKELIDSGALTDIPIEFQENSPIVSETVHVVSSNDFDMTNGHADHVDTTGEYRKAWEAKYGSVEQNTGVSGPADTSWKDFLQQIIAEEKSKLQN